MSVERLVEVEGGQRKSKAKEAKDDGEDQTLKSGKNSRTKIVIDKVDGFKSYTDQDNNRVQIYEEKHKLLFDIEKGLFCKSYYQETPKMDSELFAMLEDVEDVSSYPEKYLEVGIQMVRNVQTNVFRKVDRNGNHLKATTLYLQQSRSDANPELLTHDPAQIRFEEFEMIDGIYTIKNSLLYNFFDFESFKSENELEEALSRNLVQCFDGTNVASLSIVAKRGEHRTYT